MYVFSNEVWYVVFFTTIERFQTCRVVWSSSFPVGEGVPPSSDAGVTGEEAMFPPRHSQLLLVWLSAVRYTSSSIQPPLLLREDRSQQWFPVRAQWLSVRLHSEATVPPPAGARMLVVQSSRWRFSLSVFHTHTLSLCHTHSFSPVHRALEQPKW